MATTTRIRFLAPVTTHVFNPAIRLFAGSVPGLGLLIHTGRTTGRAYRTPLLVLKRGDHYLVGLWYGSDVHWVKNVLAAGGCEMLINGRRIRTVDPEVMTDGVAQLLPPPLALAGRIVHLTEVLRLHQNSIRIDLADQRTEKTGREPARQR